MMEYLPPFNALINSTSAVLLTLGHRAMKKGMFLTHRRYMLGAFGCSIMFLISYITYHWHRGTTHFLGEGWIRPVYFFLLTTHTLLAAFTLPLSLITLGFGLKGMNIKHRKIAKFTYPVWLYVSITGVVIYLMLYQIYPSR